MRRFGSLVLSLGAVLWISSACGSTDSDGNGAPGGASADAGASNGLSGDNGSGATRANGGANEGAATGLPGAGETSSAGSLGVGGAGGPGGPNCKTFDEICVQSTECCSGVCDPNTNACASVVGACVGAGQGCVTATDCCNLHCGDDGKCSAAACTSDAEECTADSECCSGVCMDGACGTLNASCSTAGNACLDNLDCCSGLCGESGTCTLGGSFCIQPGDVCSRPQDCCTGDCTIAAGASLGTCSDPPEGPAFCKGVDGVLCSDCGDCCSRLCAPFGATGVNICQPANGCHVTGDLCRRNEDCCGGTVDESLPGYGNVTCEIEPGKPVGLCRNPNNGPGPGGACNPQGNVCHYKNYSCDISSARANCCGGLGAKGGVCQLDPLGIPRCNGLGDDCRTTGETCASTDDCCDDRPCVPDANGVLRCGTSECQKSGSGCTVNADCCPGVVCIRAPGSTLGTCGGDPPPDGSAGAPSTGGTSGSGGTGSTPPSCSQYGQLCDIAGDCCNMVPCTNGICRFPVE